MDTQNHAMSVGEVLVRALCADPDDLAAHAAYADWLTEHGDPRGEFIQLQLALAGRSCAAWERPYLHSKAGELFDQHAKQWLGELNAFRPHLTFQFTRGWLSYLAIDTAHPQLAGALGHTEQARLLHTLVLSDPMPLYYPVVEYDPPTAGDLPLLVVQQGANQGESFPLDEGRSRWQIGRCKSCQIVLPSPSTLPVVSRRQAVITRVGGSYYLKDGDGHQQKSKNGTFVNHEPVKLPYARLLHNNDAIRICDYVLTFQDSLPVPYAYTPPPAAIEFDEDFALDVGPEEPEEALADVRYDFLAALAASPYLGNVRVLCVSTQFGDAYCTALVRSGFLKRLRVLDLANASVGYAGVHVLAGCAEVARLEKVVLTRFYNSENWTILQRAGIRVEEPRPPHYANTPA
jgi:uncharacterized protein (TIGR02996 family)